MRLVTRTETTASIDVRSARAQAHARRLQSTDCRCGQQLDMCAGAHCPRCGRSLSHA